MNGATKTISLPWCPQGQRVNSPFTRFQATAGVSFHATGTHALDKPEG
jgi:hypothetical protein